MRVVTVVMLILLGWMQAARAVTPDEVLSDPVLEARARHLSKELRCMVCQNQSIDDSEAPLAHDLRVLVRERLTAGDTDKQVIDFLVARYGEFVLLRPPLNAHTAILWFAAPGVLVGGALALWLMAAARRRRHAAPVTRTEPDGGVLTAAEVAALDELMKSGRA